MLICEMAAYYRSLGVQEDSDIETVISNLLLIGKHLSMKMFDYGMEEERKQEKKHI